VTLGPLDVKDRLRNVVRQYLKALVVPSESLGSACEQVSLSRALLEPEVVLARVFQRLHVRPGPVLGVHVLEVIIKLDNRRDALSARLRERWRPVLVERTLYDDHVDVVMHLMDLRAGGRGAALTGDLEVRSYTHVNVWKLLADDSGRLERAVLSAA